MLRKIGMIAIGFSMIPAFAHAKEAGLLVKVYGALESSSLSTKLDVVGSAASGLESAKGVAGTAVTAKGNDRTGQILKAVVNEAGGGDVKVLVKGIDRIIHARSDQEYLLKISSAPMSQWPELGQAKQKNFYENVRPAASASISLSSSEAVSGGSVVLDGIISTVSIVADAGSAGKEMIGKFC